MSPLRSGPSLSRYRRTSLLAGFCLTALALLPAEAQLVPAMRNLDINDPATINALPALLSQTGLYRNIANKATRAISDTNAIVYFEVNSPLWSDGTAKQRFISLPSGTKATPTDSSKYAFPDGTVMVKNFSIDTVYKDSTTRIFIETRFLVLQVNAGVTTWTGVSYKWRRDQTDAERVDPDFGENVTMPVKLNGTLVGKRWRYPSIMDCAECHRGDVLGRGTLGFVTQQLNRIMGGTNQLDRLVARNVLTANPVAGKTNVHRWYGLAEGSATLEQKARSYLASNCSHCHGSNATFTQASHNFDYFTAAKKITITDDPVGGWVGKATDFSTDYRYLVVPGKPESSYVMGKMMTRKDDELASPEYAQMPPLATSQVDSSALAVLRDWICSLKAGTTNCKTPPWLPDTYNWDEEGVSSIHGRVTRMGPAARVRLQGGMLTLPATLKASGIVELRDSQGRIVPLQPVGDSQYRLPAGMHAGAYLLRAGSYSALLPYLP